MKNEYMRPALELSLPVVDGTVSGDPVRVGAANGVAATGKGEGTNPAGNASVVTDARSYLLEVEGAIPGPFTPVYLTPRSGSTAPKLSVTGSGSPWGYTVPKVGETDSRTATSGQVPVRPAQI